MPNALSLVACDDSDVLELHSPAIDVVRRDPYTMGESAANLLLRALAHEERPRRVLLPTEYVARGSVAPPPSSHVSAPE